ncbi:MAG TPA: hypothetical protein VNO21_02040 [Polyangiaceae bacterium]|nr:hypothetical protein [Polyangiaceae bacterium]
MRSATPKTRLAFLVPLFTACAIATACSDAHETRQTRQIPEESTGTTSQDLAPARHDPRTALVLPGPAFYPESVNMTPDGTFYVGSLGTGAVVRVPRGATNAEPFVAPQASLLTLGVLPDVARHTLWTCVYDETKIPPAQQPSSIRGYDLTSGTRIASYDMPGNADSFCNDLALDERGNLYATDSAVNTLVKLAPDAKALVTWATNPLFAPAPGSPGNFPTLNGILFDRYRHRLIVAKSDGNQILSVPIRLDGRPGDVSVIAIDPPVLFPDGIEQVDENTLVANEHMAGTVSVVKLSNHGTSGQKQVIASDLREPTSATIFEGSAWVSVSQERFFDGQPGSPTLPFAIQRFALP